MSGAASSSTISGFQGLPQNSLNQRPTTALFFSSFDIRDSFSIVCPTVRKRNVRRGLQRQTQIRVQTSCRVTSCLSPSARLMLQPPVFRRGKNFVSAHRAFLGALGSTGTFIATVTIIPFASLRAHRSPGLSLTICKRWTGAILRSPCAKCWRGGEAKNHGQDFRCHYCPWVYHDAIA
jgi:hypothetical protein